MNKKSNINRIIGTLIVAAAVAGAGLQRARAATKYWDTTAGAGNGVGGSATWGTTFSTASTGDASLTTAATTDDDIFQGTAGTITLSASQTANSLTFNTTGYAITTSGSSTRVLAGGITLGNNVSLTLAPINAAPMTISSVTGGTSSGLTVGGSTSAAGDAIRINLASGTTIASSAPITISTTGTQGIAGFASNGGTATISAGITNNSGVTTSLGATSGNTLNVNGAISGTAGLQFSAGSSGGAGTINLGAASTYQGATVFNAASGAIIKLGVDNALPSGTNVTMAASSSNGGILDLNGHNLTIASLTSGAGGGSITNNASGSGANTLTISGSTSPAAFGLAITDGTTAKTAITRSGSGTTILSGANTYTGATQITGGTLNVTGSLGNTAVTISNSNSTLSSGVNTTSAITGSVTANNGTFITPGGAGTVGTLTVGGLTLNNGSSLNMDILGSSNYDKIVTSGVLTLGSGTVTINIAGSGFSAGSYTLLSGYSSLSGGAFTLGTTPGSFNYSLSTGATSTVLTISGLGGGGSLTWSLGGLAPTSGTDGSGTWTNGGTNFYNTGSSSATTWDNTATNNLTVGSGGAGGTITLGGNVRVGGTLTFATVSSPYTIGTSGGTNTLTLAGGITANNSATINAPTVLEVSQTWSVANGNTLTANGAISETGGTRALTKDGAGTLVLTGTGNSYTGGTNISNGTVSISAGSSTGAGNVTVSSGATLAGAGTVNGTTSVTSGTISGSGLALTGAATFNGTGNNLNGTVSSAGGTIFNASSALMVNGALTVTGSAVAATVSGNNATLTNLGTISQTGTGRGIFNSASTGLVINNGSATNSTALIQTADADVVRSNSGGVTLNNYGTLTSLNASAGGSQAVDFNPIASGSNTVNNFSTGIMQATEADAVRPGVNGAVNNAGLIKSTWVTASSGSSSDGVDAQNNSGVVITNASNWSSGAPATPGTGTIEGARSGITGGALNSSVTFTTTVTNNLGGVIQGDNGSGINLDGFNANQSATIVNNGTITGNGRDIGNGVSHDGDGIDVDGLVNVTNTGIIRSINSFNIVADGVAHSEGITVGGGTIINSGTIEGLVSAGNTNAIGIGISLLGNDITTGPLAGTREAIYGNATVTNQAGGLIRGDSGSGILVDGPASGFNVTINNNAGATIRGGATLTGLGGASAAILTAADNDTINNAGTIDGSSNGKAIDMGTGNNTLNITGGSASITGDISGGTGGTNALTIDPGAGNSFSYSGAISNFSSAEVKSGTVTLSGASTYAGNTNVSGGKLLVTGSISGNATIASAAVLGSGNNQTSSVGAVTAASDANGGGTLAPGDTGGNGLTSVGKLNVNGALSLGTNGTAGSAHLAIELGGHTAGSQYDQIAATGGVTLGNVTLDLSLVNGLGATIANGDLFFILINGGGAVTGSFANQSALADANGFHTVTAGNGQQFEISYTASAISDAFAASGNDIAIQAVPEPSTFVIFLGCAGMVAVFRRRGKSRIG
jgi:autotransporter-associated beta strand protein